MPSRTKRVRFETEYNSSFKAFDPDIYKSPLIAALVDDPGRNKLDKTNTAAGLESNKFLKPVEPPLQTKSKPDVQPGQGSKTILHNEKHNVDAKRGHFVKLSGNRTKENRALRFKAGLKHDNSLEQAKFPVSEYQQEYEWKSSAIDDSPLLNAEKIVFDSHTNIPRFVRDKIPRKTEYQSRFDEQVVRKRKKENKDEEIEGEKNEDNPTTAVKRLLQTSHNPDPPFFPHGSNRVLHTEYQANFASPKKYEYEKGIWLGAKPPHLLPDDQSTTGSSEHVTNWFEEVLELRAKARQYKIRAIEGNYFSREYLAQLDAELEELHVQQNEASKKKKKSGSVNVTSPSERPCVTSPQERPHVKHAWAESDGSSEKSHNNNDVINDGKKVYRHLDKQFRDVSLDSETLSSHSEHDSPDDEQCCKPFFGETAKPTCRGNIKRTVIKNDIPSHSEDSSPGSQHSTENNRTKPSFDKNPKPAISGTVKSAHITEDKIISQDLSNHRSKETVKKKSEKPILSKTVSANQKQPSTLHRKAAPKKHAVVLRSVSSGSDASSEFSEESKQSPDKFDIKYIQGMRSNDAPNTSLRSNYGSKSISDYVSDSHLSQSSIASGQIVAQQTLAHAKQRNAHFWH